MAILSHQSHELGHLGLVIRDTEYATINGGNSWSDQPAGVNKAKKPSTLKDAITDFFKTSEAIREWQSEKATHTTFVLTRDALKQQIVGNVEDQYINVLKKNITAYATVTSLETLTHL